MSKIRMIHLKNNKYGDRYGVITSDGTMLEHTKGKFDTWAIKIYPPGATKETKVLWPLDSDYFGEMLKVGEKYGKEKLYNDFVTVYEMVTENYDSAVLEKIYEVSLKYNEFSTLVEKDFIIMYYGMIAEENKAFTRLGKRIKRLGMYSTLMTNNSVQYSANYMRNMSWQEIDKICKEYGF